MSNVSKRKILGKVSPCPTLRFSEDSLTSYAGLVIFQSLFTRLALKQRLSRCFTHLPNRRYGHHIAMMILIVYLLLGYRDLRDSCFYRDDEMVKRLLGLKSLPSVATLSRTLASADEHSVHSVRHLNRSLVAGQPQVTTFKRLTLDFDGTVISTRRHAEGVALGFNKRHRGQRSYYPLLCTLAQTGQVFDVLHRPGNVHDINGARVFISESLRAFERTGVQLETRMDSAFYSKDIVDMLDERHVEFTISVPFTRYPILRRKVEERQRWRRINDELSYFEDDWKPESWDQRYRFLFIRRRVMRKRKLPLQLDLFEPRDTEFEYKAIVTNKRHRPDTIVAYHEGRGAQECVIGELKSQCQMSHVPVSTRCGNQLYLLAAMLTHNLTRTLQMDVKKPARGQTPKRSAFWTFEKLETLRRQYVQRAGRLIKPAGRLVLSMSCNQSVQHGIRQYLSAA